jgi:hypothetical protein
VDAATELRMLAGIIRLNLTPREREIAWLYIQGISTDEIATRLGLGRSTVNQRLSQLWLRIGPPPWDDAYVTRSPVRLLRVLMGEPAAFHDTVAA